MKQQFKINPPSLSFKQILIRFIIAGVVILFVSFFTYFLNQWYFYSQNKNQKESLILTKESKENSETKDDELTSPKDNISLTFYDRLTQKKSKNVPSEVNAFKKKQYLQKKKTTYTVQVGSFQSLKSAETTLEDLKQKGFSPFITPVHFPRGEIWYRVRIGNFSLREEAEEIAKELKEKGNYAPLVLSLKHTD